MVVLSKHLEGVEMAACGKFVLCFEEIVIIIITIIIIIIIIIIVIIIIIIIVSWLCVVFLFFVYVLYLYSNAVFLIGHLAVEKARK